MTPEQAAFNTAADDLHNAEQELRNCRLRGDMIGVSAAEWLVSDAVARMIRFKAIQPHERV